MRQYRAGDDLETVRNIVNEAFVKSMMMMTCDDLERSYRPEWRDRLDSSEQINCDNLIVASAGEDLVRAVFLTPHDDTVEISSLVGPGVGGRPAGLRRESQHQDTGGGDQLGQRPVENIHKEGIQVSRQLFLIYIRLT